MFAKRVYSILILTIFGFTSALTTSSKFLKENTNYFPLVVKYPPNIGVIVTKQYNDAFTGDNFISGYVINWSDEPYYSTTLLVNTIFYPYCDPSDPFYDDCDPYIGLMHLDPAFSTTLPGQINPFFDSNLCYKACTTYHNVFVENATHDPPDESRYFPLTLVSWNYTTEDEYKITIHGSIRNDRDEILENLRLVLSNLENCYPREAEINEEILKPGGRTTFQIKEYGKYCLNDKFVFVGQGEAMP